MRIALLTTDNREHFKNYHATTPCFGTAPEALLQGFAEMPDVDFHVVCSTQKPMRSPDKIAKNIWFHSLHVPKIGWLRTFYRGCIRAVRGKLREIQPDLVHGQGTERDCAISAVFSGFSNIVTIHGNMAELSRRFPGRVGSYGWLAARLENFALSRTAGVFCNSTYTENLVRSRARRTWRVANALRQEFFNPVTNISRGREQSILLCVGDITPRKRQVELLDVARALWQQSDKFEFHFIGRADSTAQYAAEFFDRLKPFEANGTARYLGELSTGELIQYFDGASGLVHFPSEEAFGLVVAEALARNLKFFGARTGGIPDIAGGIEGAELFEPNDQEGLRNAIAKWLIAGYPRPQSAAAEMRKRYHPEVIARRHLEIYREVLSHTS